MDDQQCVFNMYGGEISGNNGKNYGGAIFRKFNANMPNTTGGAFNMYGGTIKNNTALNGGAFFSTTGGTVNLAGGTISDNKATQSDNDAGGGAHLYARLRQNQHFRQRRDHRKFLQSGRRCHSHGLGHGHHFW